MKGVMRVASVVAVCVLALMSAAGTRAQTTEFPIQNGTVVSASVPQPSLNAFGFGCINLVCDQTFSIGLGGAYVNQLNLPLEAESAATYPMTVVITNSVSQNPQTGVLSYGTIFQEFNGSVTFPSTSCTDEGSGALPCFLIFTDSFSTVWLPPGTYHIVMEGTPANPSVGLANGGPAWQAGGSGYDLPALTTVGVVGPDGVWVLYPPSGFLGEPPPTAFLFDLDGPVIVPPVGGSKLEKVRLVAGPVTPPIGGPVQMQVGFLNAETGALLSPLTPITISPGPTQTPGAASPGPISFVDLDLTPLVARVGQRLEVQPVIVQSPGAAGATGATNPGPVNFSATVQVLDELTGFQAVSAPVPQPGAAGGVNPGLIQTGLSPQILAGAQTMRFDILASGPDPCVGQVNFSDANGNALIPAVQVNLAPGTGTTVDLTSEAASVRLGQEIEVQPVLTLSLPAAAVGQNSVCNASVEVFDQVSGRSWSHQNAMVGLSAVQTNPGPQQTPVTPPAGGPPPAGGSSPSGTQ